MHCFHYAFLNTFPTCFACASTDAKYTVKSYNYDKVPVCRTSEKRIFVSKKYVTNKLLNSSIDTKKKRDETLVLQFFFDKLFF